MKDMGELGVTSDVEQHLEEIMIKELNEALTEPIEADEQAELRLSWLKGLAKKAVQIQNTVDNLNKKNSEWGDQQLEYLQKKIKFVMAPLRFYLEGINRQSGGKKKSISLPTGRIQLIQPKDNYIWEDEVKLLEWAKVSLPDAVQVKETIKKPEIKEHIKKTGEIPEGLRIELGSEKQPKFHIMLSEIKDCPIPLSLEPNEEEKTGE